MRRQFTNEKDLSVSPGLRLTRRYGTSIAAVLSTLAPAIAGAVGLGPIESFSSLNQPFSGRIELLDVAPGEVDSLTVRLADNAQFERAGIAKTAAVLQLDLRVQQDGKGREYILISTKEPFREPFLNFLLELNWANGRLVREYTVLLDPPEAVTRRAPQQAAGGQTRTSSAVRERQVQEQTGQRPLTLPQFSGSEYGPTRTGDTLWSIAASVRPDSSVSVHQMMIALLRANPQAFINGNINVLRQGAILRVPDRGEIDLSEREAVAEVRRQTELWQGYRQTSSSAAAFRPVQPSTPTKSPDQVDQPGSRAPQPRLDIVAPRDGGAGREPTTGATEARLGLVEERLAAAEQEAKELQSKLAESEEIISLLERQIDIKDDELATLQQRSAQERPASQPQPAPEARTPTAEPRTPAPAAPKPAVAAPAKVVPAEPSGFLDNIPGGAAAVGGVAAGLLALAGWFGFRRLRRRDEVTEVPQRTIVAGAATVPAVVARAEERFETTQPPVAERTVVDEVPADQLATIEAEQEALAPVTPAEDPIEEVNVYLAYERFDQAEQLVRKAIAQYPNEHSYKLRLLEVFYSANDPRKYEEAARDLRDAVNGSGPLWDSALAMWNEMSPNRKLFDEGVEFSTLILTPNDMQKFVDLTGGDNAAATPLTERTLVGLPPLVGRSAPAAEIDLDLAGDEEADKSQLDEDGLFDLTATMEDDLIDLTASTPLSEQSVDMIDLTSADKSSQVETLFDVSGPSAAVDTLQIGDDLLDITGGDRAEDEFPAVDLADTSDLLDVTRSGDLTGAEDLEPLNVTSPGDAASKAETLLDLTRGHLDDTHQAAARPETLGFTASETAGAMLADTNAGPSLTSDYSLDFDISSPGTTETGDDTGLGDGFDLALETTGDLEALSAESDKSSDDALDFDLDLIVDDSPESSTVAKAATDGGTVSAAEPREPAVSDLEFENMLDDAKRSMQTLQLGDDDIEFDLSLEDTGELSALRDSEIEMPGNADESLGRVDETLADLATSMEDTVAGLEESDDELERSLDLGARIESDVFQSTVSQNEVTRIADGGTVAGDADEIDTKLNLAKAYVELGDVEGARAILDEVVADGDDDQRAAARLLLGEIAGR